MSFRSLPNLLLLSIATLFGPVWAQIDTIEVYVLRVEFQREETDNSLTTGRGAFDSDGDTTGAAYTLDPQGQRGSPAYWLDKLRFANQWFQQASNGKVVITGKVFPTATSAYRVSKQIIDYNRTGKRKDEKQAEFDDARAADYMTFVRDAVLAAHRSGDSPFQDSLLDPAGRKHRVFLIAHAGASRLVDGGSLGSNGADTPGDFMDVYVGPDSWPFLQNVPGAEDDTAGVTLESAPLGKLREVMVISETASQDGLNWGINGILVNQLARQIGLPSTYDVVKGVSRLGSFDAMDFAGYNSGNGFFPVLPSAWLRGYMGWATARELFPDENGKAIDTLWTMGSGAGAEVLKVAIAPDEYLLLENRQRSLDSLGNLTVTIGERDVTVPVDSFSTLFLDSLCDSRGACRANSRKARGSVLAITHNDAGLPASGVAVWRVNEWYLRESMRYGATAFWAGDTFRDHQTGLALVEADGVLAIGKEFKNALGQAAYDYGSGTDLLPNRRHSKDTIHTISPYGYSNTASTAGGQSGVAITVRPLPGARVERTWSAFAGDSVDNWHSKGMVVEVQWPSSRMPSSVFPKRVMPGRRQLSLAPLIFPGKPETAVLMMSDNGTLQVMGPRGDSLMLPGFVALPESYDSTTSLIQRPVDIAPDIVFSIQGIGAPQGNSLAMATRDSTAYSLHSESSTNLSGSNQLVRTALRTPDSGNTFGLSFDRISATLTAASLGPVIGSQVLWVASADSLWGLVESSLVRSTAVHLPSGMLATSLALCGDVDGDGERDPVIAGMSGALAIFRTGESRIRALELPSAAARIAGEQSESYRIACTDFDRNGSPDAFVLGSLGAGWIVDLASGELLSTPRRYQRGFPRQGKPQESPYHETSGIALADINADGYPEAIFAGHNAIFAITNTGVPLEGFPYRIHKGSDEELMGSDPLVFDVDGNGALDIVFSTAMGVIHAIDSKGIALRSREVRTSNSGELRVSLFDWPLAAGKYPFSDTLLPFPLMAVAADSVRGPELYAYTDSWVNGWSLQKVANPASTDWLMAGGSAARDYHLDASALPVPAAISDVEALSDAFFFPNPARGGKVKLRFSLGAPASDVRVRLYDISGMKVIDRSVGALARGRQQVDDLDISSLGSDVYSWEIEARFAGQTKKVRGRLGVVR